MGQYNKIKVKYVDHNGAFDANDNLVFSYAMAGPMGPANSVNVDNAKTPTSSGAVGEQAVGEIGGTWYLFVCYAPNQWGRILLGLTW
jgi:hypothetical protein